MNDEHSRVGSPFDGNTHVSPMTRRTVWDAPLMAPATALARDVTERSGIDDATYNLMRRIVERFGYHTDNSYGTFLHVITNRPPAPKWSTDACHVPTTESSMKMPLSVTVCDWPGANTTSTVSRPCSVAMATGTCPGSRGSKPNAVKSMSY